VGHGGRDLRCAGVGGDDAPEMGGEADRRLAVPGGAVPREVGARGQGRKLGEELRGVARTVGGVLSRRP
jgi:hypothetical protein